MDPLQIKRLKEEHTKSLEACEEKIAQWEKFKTDYGALNERLETLPDALSYDVTVPFGSNAFTLGKIVHTNEVTVLLGDNWFAKVSGKQACGIANRRIEHCNKMLEDLKKEKEQINNWLNYIGEVSVNDNLVEIVEKYDEKEEEKWRERHAISLREHRLKEKDSKKEDKEMLPDYFAQLDLLASNKENEETEEDENMDLQDMVNDHEEDMSHTQQLTSTEDESERIDDATFPLQRLTSTEDESERPDDAASPSILEDENGKHVRWRDLSNPNPIPTITFRHTKAKHKHQAQAQNTEEYHPLIESPSDIYMHYFPPSPPKSILKVKTPPPIDEEFNPFQFQEAFTGEVQERRSSESNGTSNHTPKERNGGSKHHKPSQFKNSRKNRKR